MTEPHLVEALLNDAVLEIERLQAEITRLRASPWVAVEERLPEVGEEPILTIEPGHEFPRLNGFRTQREYEGEAHAYRDVGPDFDEYEEYPTHWMPIPPLDQEDM